MCLAKQHLHRQLRMLSIKMLHAGNLHSLKEGRLPANPCMYGEDV